MLNVKTDYCYKAIHFKPQLLCEERLGHFNVSQISRITQIYLLRGFLLLLYLPQITQIYADFYSTFLLLLYYLA